MKKILFGILAVTVALLFASSTSFAIAKQYQKKGVEVEQGGKDSVPYKDPAQKEAESYEKGDFHKKVTAKDFPEKGWHKGPYVTANVGLMQITNDKHIITGAKFGSSVEPAFGISFGWDIADWIGPLLQINYSTGTGTVGDAANDTSQGGGATTYPSWDPTVTFDANTFPVQSAREHAVDVGLFARATLPYFTRAQWQPKMVKIIPYFKLGGQGHAVWVKASTAANMAGAVGGGPAVGAGVEFFIWKGFFFALDFTETFIFQKAFSKTFSVTVNGVAQSNSYKITEGGVHPQALFVGMIGWHF